MPGGRAGGSAGTPCCWRGRRRGAESVGGGAEGAGERQGTGESSHPTPSSRAAIPRRRPVLPSHTTLPAPWSRAAVPRRRPALPSNSVCCRAALASTRQSMEKKKLQEKRLLFKQRPLCTSAYFIFKYLLKKTASRCNDKGCQCK